MKILVKLTRGANCAHYGVPKGATVSLDLEREYLPLCVSSEVYEHDARTPPEAKKAQAVAARTFALRHMRQGTVPDDTTENQAFVWKPLGTVPNCARAVRDTAEQVLMSGGAPITAWYSISNGGHTRTSAEAWATETAWTVSKDDPWDTAGRAKWGISGASHGVGMSQIGAAYGASIGKDYLDILAFYYPSTSLAGAYGAGSVLFHFDTREEGANQGEREQKDEHGTGRARGGVGRTAVLVRHLLLQVQHLAATFKKDAIPGSLHGQPDVPVPAEHTGREVLRGLCGPD